MENDGIILFKNSKKKLTLIWQSDILRAHTETKHTSHMRTKTLLLAAALVAAGVATSMAQTVYSVNAVGYVKYTNNGSASLVADAGPLYSLISNPLDNKGPGGNTILAVLPPSVLGVFQNLLLWDASLGTFLIYHTDFSGNWVSDQDASIANDIVFAPGQGGFLAIDHPVDLTFTGDVPEGDLVNPIPAGLSIRSSQVPQAGDADSLGLTAALSLFDNVQIWHTDPGPLDGNSYDVYTLSFSGWVPSVPQFKVGQAFFINAGANASWNRTFHVSP